MGSVDAGDGRVHLPKCLRETYGDRFELVDRADRLVPTDEDPAAASTAELA